MHERTVFTKKRPNACPKELPVRLTVQVTHYTKEHNQSSKTPLNPFSTENLEFHAKSKSELDEIIEKLYQIKLKNIQIPGRTQSMKIQINGAIGDKEININARDLLGLQTELEKLQFDEPVYESWALKLRLL